MEYTAKEYCEYRDSLTYKDEKKIKRKLNKKSEVERQKWKDDQRSSVYAAVSLRLSLHVKENSKKEFSVPSKLLYNFVGSDPLTNVQHIQ